jgi:hypothetical protein
MQIVEQIKFRSKNQLNREDAKYATLNHFQLAVISDNSSAIHWEVAQWCPPPPT